MPQLNETCTDHTPPWFVGHWRDWHRGHGCNKDDGKLRAAAAATEIEQHAANADTGFLTDAELSFLRASTTSGNTLLVRALDELAARREGKKRSLAHCMTGAPGYHCSCGATFDDYYGLAEHVRQSIDCPRCGGTPTDLEANDLFSWKCGHWIERGDTSAKIRGDRSKQ
jgi:hypothetical protein